MFNLRNVLNRKRTNAFWDGYDAGFEAGYGTGEMAGFLGARWEDDEFLNGLGDVPHAVSLGPVLDADIVADEQDNAAAYADVDLTEVKWAKWTSYATHDEPIDEPIDEPADEPVSA